MQELSIVQTDSDLTHLTNEQLVSKIAECLQHIATDYLTIVRYANVLKARGVELSFITRGTWNAIKYLEAGTMLPETFVALRDLAALEHVGRFGHEQQRAILAKGTVEVYERVGTSDTHRSIPLDELLPAQCRLVFDNGRVRTIEEQANFYRDRQLAKELQPPRREKILCYNPKKDVHIYGNIEIPGEVLKDYVQRNRQLFK
jgi:hypothetical protein